MLGEGEWVDAQPFLAAVCAGMGVGELLHGETFSLFDSTTAIEIGDAKMDVACNRNEDIGTAEELIAGGAAPVSLPPRLLLAVMDRLLVLEATWHAGSMLPQTIFTSLYMLQPDRFVTMSWGWRATRFVTETLLSFASMANGGSCGPLPDNSHGRSLRCSRPFGVAWNHRPAFAQHSCSIVSHLPPRAPPNPA